MLSAIFKPLSMSAGKPSMEEEVSVHKFVHNIETLFSCHKLDNSFIRCQLKHYYSVIDTCRMVMVRLLPLDGIHSPPSRLFVEGSLKSTFK